VRKKHHMGIMEIVKPESAYKGKKRLCYGEKQFAGRKGWGEFSRTPRRHDRDREAQIASAVPPNALAEAHRRLGQPCGSSNVW
jgi:hypothetical protein